MFVRNLGWGEVWLSNVCLVSLSEGKRLCSMLVARLCSPDAESWEWDIYIGIYMYKHSLLQYTIL